MRIGVLGLQGDVSEHIDIVNKTLEEEGIQGEVVCVKKPLEIDKLHGIIIPGGESTVIGRLAEKLNIIRWRKRYTMVERRLKRPRKSSGFLRSTDTEVIRYFV